jgi:hypothetical protein
VTDFALRERLGYQIPADKVMWDHQGNPKKLSLSSEKAGSGSPAQPPSKKSRAHKNIGASSKAATDSQPIWIATVHLGLHLNPRLKAPRWLNVVVGEGSSGLKQKSGEDASASEPPTKKRRAGKAKELLWTIAFVCSDSVPASYGPPSNSRDVRPSDKAISLDVVPLDAQQEPNASGNRTGNPSSPNR